MLPYSDFSLLLLVHVDCFVLWPLLPYRCEMWWTVPSLTWQTAWDICLLEYTCGGCVI